MKFILQFLERISSFFTSPESTEKIQTDKQPHINKMQRQFFEKNLLRKSKNKFIRKHFKSQNSSINQQTLAPTFKYENGSDISIIDPMGNKKCQSVSAVSTIKFINRLMLGLENKHKKNNRQASVDLPMKLSFKKKKMLSLWDRIAYEDEHIEQKNIQ